MARGRGAFGIMGATVGKFTPLLERDRDAHAKKTGETAGTESISGRGAEYAHILDEDRKVNAQKFETAFYAKPDLRNVRPPEEPVKSEPATLDLESLVEQLQKSPELASALAALIAAQAPAK